MIVLPDIETSQVICCANQLTNKSVDWFLYEGVTLALNGLMKNYY